MINYINILLFDSKGEYLLEKGLEVFSGFSAIDCTASHFFFGSEFVAVIFMMIFPLLPKDGTVSILLWTAL